jgi:hypothetical protein
MIASAGCGKKEPNRPLFTLYYSFSGHVTTSAGPLVGAKVTLRSPAGVVSTITTDASGGYAFTRLEVEGHYSIEVEHPGYSFVPAGHVGYASVFQEPDLDFTGTPASGLHGLQGTVSGAGSTRVRLRLSGENTGELMEKPGGGFRFGSLLVGDYMLTPFTGGHTFTPPSRTITGTIAFDHPLSGTLGNASLLSVIHNGQSVVAFFDLPIAAPEGQGTIRARRRSEIAAPDLAAYDAMWTAGDTVVVTYNSSAGNDTIELLLGPNPTMSSSAPRFHMIETLADSTALDFTATPI